MAELHTFLESPSHIELFDFARRMRTLADRRKRILVYKLSHKWLDDPVNQKYVQDTKAIEIKLFTELSKYC